MRRARCGRSAGAWMARVTEADIVKRGMSHRALRRIAYGRMRMTIRLTVVGFAALMLVPTLADAQGLTWHYEPDSLVGTPDVTFAPQQHLAQQYDPPSLPPEIMVPERRPVGRQRAAPQRRITEGAAMMRLTTATYTEPLPQPEVGACPAGYRESVGYCAPTSGRAPAAVPKRGQCPSNWTQSRAYCVEMRRRRPPSESAVTGCRRSGAESM